MAEEISRISTLEVQHNGWPGELEVVYDSGLQQVTITGFIAPDSPMTQVDIQWTTNDLPNDIISTYLIRTPLDDINSMATRMVDLLTSSIINSELVVVDYTPARVQTDFTLNITFADFGETDPALTILQGSNNLTIALSEEADIPLAHMQGICGARGRMFAWDRLNALYRGSHLDALDFLPAIATQATVGTIAPVVGNIISLQESVNGFQIYSNANIVFAMYVGGDIVYQYNEVAPYGLASPDKVINTKLVSWFLSGDTLFELSQEGSVKPVLPNMSDLLYPMSNDMKLSYDGRYLYLYIYKTSPYNLQQRAFRDSSALALFDYLPRLENLSARGYVTPARDSYDRVLALDTLLGKWGSCDQPVAHLFSYAPMLSPAARQPDERVKATQIGLVDSEGRVYQCSFRQEEAGLLIGHIKGDAQKWARLLKVEALGHFSAISPISMRAIPAGRYSEDIIAEWGYALERSSSNQTYLFNSVAYSQLLTVIGQFDLTLLAIHLHSQGKF